MSGPKVDHVELERQRRIALEKARQEKLRKIKLAMEQFNSAQSNCRKKADWVKHDRIADIEEMRSYSQMEYTVKDIQTIKAKYISRLDQLTKSGAPSGADDIIEKTKSIQGEVDTLIQGYQSEIKNEFERIDSFIQELRKQKSYSEFSSKLTTGEKKKTTKIAGVSFNAKEQIVISKEKEQTSQSEKFNPDELEELISHEAIEESDRNGLLQIANRMEKAREDNDKVAYRTAVDAFQIAKVKVLQKIFTFEKLYNDYLSEYYGYKEDFADVDQALPKQKSSFCSIEELNTEIERIRKAAKQKNEQNYIREQINEVMKEFGHTMCEDIVLMENQKGKHYLYINQDNPAAIHVHVSEENQIMMEVVGVRGDEGSTYKNGANARLEPVDSEQDAYELLEEQGRFCSIHPKIVERLAERGVLLTQKVHRKPARENCKIMKLAHGKELGKIESSVRKKIKNVDKRPKARETNY